MKVFDKIWNILGLVDTDEPLPSPPVPADRSVSRMERKSERPVRVLEESKSRRITQLEPARHAAEIPDKTPFPATGGKGSMMIVQPTGFDDARQIAENLTNGHTLIVNFERTDADTTKRTVDFMSGLTYAVGGSVQRISGSIFLFSPAFVDVTCDDPHAETVPGEASRARL